MISIIETDGTCVSFWAEKPPNMLRLQLGSALGFDFLVALSDVGTTGYPGVDFGAGGRDFCPSILRGGETSGAGAAAAGVAGRRELLRAVVLRYWHLGCFSS